LRKVMLSSPPLDRQSHFAALSELYARSEFYPSDLLDVCEVVKTRAEPSGWGGFGKCWEGEFLGHHPVAMKCSHDWVPDNIAMRHAQREMAAWKGLRHPNILPFIGSVTLESKFYMVSPWMENGDVVNYLAGHPDADCVRLLLQIMLGLEYLHSFNPTIVHGDLKANNVLVSSAGDARITDFGLSHRLAEDMSRQGYSTAWYKAGNYRWQAPELLQAETLEQALRTTMSDMYAFGRVIYEVFTRKLPFAEITVEQGVFLAVLNRNVPTRPTGADIVSRGLDDRMWVLLNDCCNTNPSRRPAAQEVVDRLRSIYFEPKDKKPTSEFFSSLI